MRIQDLKPGDVCRNPLEEGEKGWATVMANVAHPLYQGLNLVIWHMAWEEGERRWSFDALSPLMVIDHHSPLIPMTTQQRQNNFKKVLKMGEET